MSCDTLAHNIRTNWSRCGVEVEATSSNAVRCRMPPHFEDVHEFIDALAATGAAIDLEVSCKDNVASVVFVVYACQAGRADVESDDRANANQYFVWLVACACIAQLIVLWTYRAHFEQVLKLHQP